MLSPDPKASGIPGKPLLLPAPAARRLLAFLWTASMASAAAAPQRPRVSLEMLEEAIENKTIFPMIPRPEYGSQGRPLKVHSNLFKVDIRKLPSKSENEQHADLSSLDIP